MPVPVVNIFADGDYDDATRRGADALRAGGLVVLPTETVYGAAGLLSSPEARRRLMELRGAAATGAGAQPFTVHVARAEDAMQYLGDVSDLGRRMMRKLWPGPVGLVFDVPAERRAEVAGRWGLAESDLYDAAGGITLRCPDHVVASDVIGAVDGPVVVTAAGAQSASAEQLAAELDGKVDLILDAGPTRYSTPSTIVRVAPPSGEAGDAGGKPGYQVVREGVYDQRIIERLLRTTILFVCSGNTCRSPMAEAITRRVLAEQLGVSEPELEKKGISIISAGAYAMPGARATPAAVDAVRAMGADLTAHRSRPLTVELIHQADAIFTMGRGHAAAVASLLPSARGKLATLDPSGDVEDPIGGDAALYQETASHLRGLIEQRLRELSLVADEAAVSAAPAAS